jgi:uncharacterized protein
MKSTPNSSPQKPSPSLFSFLALKSIKLYHKLNFLIPASTCRFTPSCSQYTYQAIKKYGFLKGIALGAKRISRCHPWHPGGLDKLK